MKKAFVLCLALIVSLFAVTGSIAHFTDNIEVYNNVKSGNLRILQHEFERVKNNGRYTQELKEYTQGQVIYPSYMSGEELREEAATYKYTSVDKKETTFTASLYNESLHGFVDKIVVVENGGLLDTYVRTFVAVPAYSNVEWIHLDWNKANDWDVCDEPFQADINGVPHDIWYATYTVPLESGKTTPPSLLGFYLDSKVDHDGANYTYENVPLGTGSELKILVATEAAQANEQVFTSAEEAMTETYGTPAAGRHPWASAIIAASTEELADELKNAAYNTVVGLTSGTYTLPAELPDGIRIFAMDTDVKLTAPTEGFTATDVEFDGVTFTNAVTFSGWGSFEEVVFEGGCTVTSVTDDCTVLFSFCEFPENAKPTETNSIILSNCTPIPTE